ncbi:MAG: cytochrome c oxidase accessory protein CcoG [Gammaproteobacteria bacterium]|nr:MAG: cytochrome c oxidase accessory protein CcoG [Gammaproteobacteria bacterium]
MEQPLKTAKAGGDEQLERELYAKRQKIHPREVHGIFARLRLLGVITLLGIYYLLPWVTWEGRQAVLFDLPHRKFYIFDWVFWPQDVIFLAWLLIIAALALFFFTALAGRVWCGYACPQTVWTEVFMWLEHRIEGDRPKQIKLDRMPWNREKILKRGGKHGVWLLFSLFTGFTFVGYFTPITELAGKLATFSTGPWETFWVLFYGFATYLNAGWMREQVCIYMCPYARFQGAMFDRDTLVIAYDAARGEPRGPRPRGTDPRELGLGDCIDCTICVQVCPTGIDIRNGLQYQCIACAACIDACDDVMEKMRYPKGLIRYTTENALEGKPTRIIRPRVVIYGMLLIALMAGFVYALTHRVPLRVDIMRDRNTLYRETPEGLVENVYTLKVLNMDEAPHRYRLTVSGIKGLDWSPKAPLQAPGGEVVAYPVQVRLDPVHLEHPSETIYFTVEAVDIPGLKVTEDTRFLGPVP